MVLPCLSAFNSCAFSADPPAGLLKPDARHDEPIEPVMPTLARPRCTTVIGETVAVRGEVDLMR